MVVVPVIDKKCRHEILLKFSFFFSNLRSFGFRRVTEGSRFLITLKFHHFLSLNTRLNIVSQTLISSTSDVSFSRHWIGRGSVALHCTYMFVHRTFGLFSYISSYCVVTL